MSRLRLRHRHFDIFGQILIVIPGFELSTLGLLTLAFGSKAGLTTKASDMDP